MKKRNIDRDRENYCQKSAGETCNNIILLKGNPSPSTLKDFNKKYITSNCNQGQWIVTLVALKHRQSRWIVTWELFKRFLGTLKHRKGRWIVTLVALQH